MRTLRCGRCGCVLLTIVGGPDGAQNAGSAGLLRRLASAALLPHHRPGSTISADVPRSVLEPADGQAVCAQASPCSVQFLPTISTSQAELWIAMNCAVLAVCCTTEHRSMAIELPHFGR